MNCFSCSKNLKNIINCDKCDSKFCSDSCLAFHYIFYHNEENNGSKEEDFNNSNNDINYLQNKKSPYITEGIFLKEIKYESIYEIKNFKHQIVNGQPKLLGYGSFGKVFLEVNKINKKFYAIKHMEKKRIYKALKTLDPIYSEIKIQSKISHPNIVKILYANENERYFDIVLEYANKGNLFYYIQDKKHLSESNSFRIFIQMINAIYFLHEHNYIHRDIKPENILLFENDIAKLCDFGWCVEFKDEPRDTFCGTTEYMAPEMVSGKKYGKEIDIWSLGILLYEMLHGHSPFKPNKTNFNDRDVINNIRFQKSIKYNSKLSKECMELMNHLIDKNIKRRYNLDDILNSKFVKNYEKLEYFIPNENKVEFEKINHEFQSIKTCRTHYNNNFIYEKNNNQLTSISRRNTSKDNTNNILNSVLTNENNENNKYLIKRHNTNNNFITISNSKGIPNPTKISNNNYFKSISQTRTRKLNQKFSSPKVEKINKNRLLKEENFENDNLSSIFNDESVFNNNKNTIQSNDVNNLNSPTININILLNGINFSTINNNNNERKILNQILPKENDNNSININSTQSIRRNCNTLKIRENKFIKKQINIFTSKNCDIKNLNDLKSNKTSKNIPISIRHQNFNISNNSKINEIKINQLVKYFETSNNKNNDIEKKQKKKNTFSSTSKILNINKNEDNINNNAIINKDENKTDNEIKSNYETIANNENINLKSSNKLKDILIETKNYDSNFNSLECSFDKNISESNLNKIEIIKTPKKVEDTFQIPIKNIYSKLFEELNAFNINKKF